MQRQIRNFLVVVLGAMTAGFLLVFAAAYFYGPTGTYRVENVLLAPDILPKLAYEEGHTRYLFDELLYQSYDLSIRDWKTHPVALAHYQQFYDTVVGDQSIDKPSAQIEALFASQRASRLLIKAKASNAAIKPIFQELQFADEGNHYRIELRTGDKSREWAYFRHPHIADLTRTIFTR